MQNLSAVIKQVEKAEKRIMKTLRIIFLLMVGYSVIQLALFLEKQCLI